MQTYSHFLLTAVLQQAIAPQKPQLKSSLLAGSVAPDVPLALLSVGYLLDRRLIRPHLPDKTRCSPTFNDLYFNNRWWIAAHNSLHAPLPLFALLLLGILSRHRSWGRKLVAFAIGCGLHTAVDIFTHVDDGPVLLFPLDWQMRYKAAVSYWDVAHGARTFRIFEHLLDLLLLIILIWQRITTRKQANV